jgi:DNA-binding response OmpR family regulator
MSTNERILVADDDATIRKFVGAVLQSGGYEVSEAEHGEAALHHALADLPALVLLDLVMPFKDGFEVITGLKEQPATRSIPIIVLSVKDREEDVVKALKLGADDYVTKPFSPRELVARIRKLLDRRIA